MPLHSVGENAFSRELGGVAFEMTDGTKIVRCFVTDKALTDIDPGSTGSEAECVDAFHANRQQIENLANDMYDTGRLAPDGTIRISSGDLDPRPLR